MNTRAQIVIYALLCAACIALGAFWHRGCTSPRVEHRTHTDTVRAVETVVDSIPVTRWRVLVQTERHADTAYVYAGAEPMPDGAEPVGDTTFVRSGVLLANGTETPVGWNEEVSVSLGPAGFRLEFAETPIIVPDVDICQPSTIDGNTFWTNVLYVLAGVGAGALVISLTK